MSSIDEIIESELTAIKEVRAEERKKNKKPIYSNFAVKQLYNHSCKYKMDERELEGLQILQIINTDSIYNAILGVLKESEYILNKSYLKKYIAEKKECTVGTVHNKINELIELDVLENIDKSVRITRLFLRKVFGVETKVINYKTDSKSRSKLMINRYAKGYRGKIQERMRNILDVDEKIIVLNEQEILLMHKEKYTEIQRGSIDRDIIRINIIINNKKFKDKGIDINAISQEEKDKEWIEFKKIYVISKRCEKVSFGEIETEMLNDVIDFNKY